MIAKYPPMGWNSWDCYGAAVTESIVRKNAEYMANHLKLYGWEYVVVDIQWYQPTANSHAYEPFSSLTMDEYGRLLPAVNRFPSAANGAGFKPLADYIHGLGLKFGIHIMRGMPRMAAHQHLPICGSKYGCHEAANPNSICAWNPDMYGLYCDTQAAKDYYDSIFTLYAQWGVDFIKCDDIAREYPHCEQEIELISACCKSAKRDMVLSLSPGPAPLEYAEHLKTHANMWRITDDFWDDWRLLKSMFERAEKWCIHSGSGHWPDADMLPVGALRLCSDENGWTRFTQSEQRTMMTLWCMMRSPLMVGADLTRNDLFTQNLLTKASIISISKESHCGHPLRRNDWESIWIAPRIDGKGEYMAVFNLSDSCRSISVASSVTDPFDHAHELWGGTHKQLTSDNWSITLEAHGCAVYLLT